MTCEHLGTFRLFHLNTTIDLLIQTHNNALTVKITLSSLNI